MFTYRPSAEWDISGKERSNEEGVYGVSFLSAVSDSGGSGGSVDISVMLVRDARSCSLCTPGGLRRYHADFGIVGLLSAVADHPVCG